MDQEILKLINLLPGLYYSRERIDEEIRNIEMIISVRMTPEKVKVQSKAKPKEKPEQNASMLQRKSKALKTYWQNADPEKRKKHREAITKGIQARASRLRKEKLNSMKENVA